jgi:hypothetical protein
MTAPVSPTASHIAARKLNKARAAKAASNAADDWHKRAFDP